MTCVKGDPVIVPPHCAIVCHDAGAANIMLAWCRDTPPFGARYFVDGPAAMILQRVVPGTVAAPSLVDALDGASMLLSGTGWASDLEHDARTVARARGLRSVSVIDHWINYRTRFVRHGRTVLPDEIWVTDNYALKLARAEFPSLSVVLQSNAYVAALLCEIAHEPPPPAPECLLLLEPIREQWPGHGPGEFQLLDYFVESLPRLGLAGGTRIRLRPHPSEQAGKYDDWVRAHPGLPVEITPPDEPLCQAIGRASVVVGARSYAMAVAQQAGRRVVCALPPGAPPCPLPFSGIEHLRAHESA